MEQTRLIAKLAAYGADIKGIHDRFAGDAELYERCYASFLEEPNLEMLQKTVSAGRYGEAFEPAHALKGVIGNLGLTPLYQSVCALVEALRAKDARQADQQYDEFLRQLERARAIAQEEEQEPTPEPPPQEPEQEGSRRAAEKKHVSRLIPITVITLAAGVILIVLLFSNLIGNYQQNVARESARHLIEINQQIALYVAEKIEYDWKTAHSMINAILHGGYGEDEEAFRAFLRSERDIWQVSDVLVYTENGYCMSADGKVRANDVASQTIYQARAAGEYMSIVESTVTYTIPIETEQRFHGSAIVAISVIQDVGPFLDHMHFSSFDGAAFIYLTQDNGIVLSRLTHASVSGAYNMITYLSQREIEPLTSDENAHTDADMFHSGEAITHVMRDPAGSLYVVSSPVITRQGNFRLFYFVPEEAVNRTMNSFSNDVTALSITFIALFSVAAVVVFGLVYGTRKKEFDKAIKERERTFDLLVKNTKTAFGLFSVNRERPLYTSQNAQSIIGHSFMTLRKTDAGYRMTDETGAEQDDVLRINEEMRAWDGKGEFRSGYIPNAAAPTPSYYAIELYPIDERMKEYVGIAQDVTRAHDREEATRVALEMAERANAAKERFLSNMSHDIRTPMNAIVNMTDFAMESIEDPKRLTGYLQTIRESSDHLLSLVNDILDMSRIESGQAVIDAEPFDIVKELTKVCDMARTLCMARQQTFLVDLDGIDTRSVLGDHRKLSQIMMNLLGNAVKFTPRKGVIRFTVVEIPSLQADVATMRFMVEDNGIGISKHDLARIFEPFARADDERVNSVEGTGLGLSICKSYVASMGGTIACQSEEENGSVFTVELFFHKADALPLLPCGAKSAEQTPFAGKRCLLCEDNPTNRLIGKTVLDRLGFMVDTAANGREGVNAFIASRPGTYDVIYMDIRMPVMDGYQAAVAIRESGHAQAGTIPIVAMTANVFAEDVEKARIAGMNGHVGKPLMVLTLVDETNRVLKREG